MVGFTLVACGILGCSQLLGIEEFEAGNGSRPISALPIDGGADTEAVTGSPSNSMLLIDSGSVEQALGAPCPGEEGDSYCIDNQLAYCTGGVWAADRTCSEDEVCDHVEETCLPGTCENADVGQARCVGTALGTCNADLSIKWFDWCDSEDHCNAEVGRCDPP